MKEITIKRDVYHQMQELIVDIGLEQNNLTLIENYLQQDKDVFYLSSLLSGETNSNILAQLNELNDLSRRKEKMLVDVTESSPSVTLISSQIKDRRQILLDNITNLKGVLEGKKDNISNRINGYESRLSGLTDQELNYNSLVKLNAITEEFYYRLINKEWSLKLLKQVMYQMYLF